MAEQAAIDAVKIQLPGEAESFGIDDAIIGAELDTGTTKTKTILTMLRAIAAKSASMEDVSENGSSRTNRLNERVMELIRDWQARADAEDAASGNLPVKQNARVHTAVRV